MKWGYNQQLGPFESWDAVGVKEAVEVMKKLGKKVPAKIEEMLAKKCTSFYKKEKDGSKSYYDFEKKGYVKMDENPKIILLPELKERKKIVKENAAATLVDIGDGVACLEFHTKMNSVNADMIQMISESCDIVNKDFLGMVVANHDQRMFSAGADIFGVLCAISEKQWAELGENGRRIAERQYEDEISAQAGCHGSGRYGSGRWLRNRNARRLLSGQR